MRARRWRGRLAAVAMASSLATLAAGCGGASDEAAPGAAGEPTTASSSGESGSGEPDAEPVTIARVPFCGKIPADVVTTALGAPAKWAVTRKPGDRYEVLPGQKVKEDAFYCRWQTNAETEAYGPGDAVFLISVAGQPANPAAITEMLDSRRDEDAHAQGADCEEGDPPFDADPVYSVACEQAASGSNGAAAGASVQGMIGDSLVHCYIQYQGKHQLPTARQAFETACSRIPELLGS